MKKFILFSVLCGVLAFCACNGDNGNDENSAEANTPAKILLKASGGIAHNNLKRWFSNFGRASAYAYDKTYYLDPANVDGIGLVSKPGVYVYDCTTLNPGATADSTKILRWEIQTGEACFDYVLNATTDASFDITNTKVYTTDWYWGLNRRYEYNTDVINIDIVQVEILAYYLYYKNGKYISPSASPDMREGFTRIESPLLMSAWLSCFMSPLIAGSGYVEASGTRGALTFSYVDVTCADKAAFEKKVNVWSLASYDPPYYIYPITVAKSKVDLNAVREATGTPVIFTVDYTRNLTEQLTFSGDEAIAWGEDINHYNRLMDMHISIDESLLTD